MTLAGRRYARDIPAMTRLIGGSRRFVFSGAAAALAAATLVACGDTTGNSGFGGDASLSTEIVPPTDSLAPGMHQIELGDARNGRLFIPSTYQHDTPTTLIVLLHGANGTGEGIATAFQPLAEDAGVVLLAPDSRMRTWDLIIRDFGPDVEFIDEALAWAVERVNIDPNRLTIAGFSDGATYSLGLGLSNGDLFKRVIAFSPGFLFVRTQEGMPPIFITHGQNDPILPIATTSRTIVPALENAGYTVEYHEFPGGHVISQPLAEDALAWATTP